MEVPAALPGLAEELVLVPGMSPLSLTGLGLLPLLLLPPPGLGLGLGLPPEATPRPCAPKLPVLVLVALRATTAKACPLVMSACTL